MGEVRVTGGVLRGRKVSVPSGGGARYTSSKVRAAIFDSIGSVEGLQVLDLFAGSGLFSIEALSRGAERAVCVEKNRAMASVLKENLDRLGLDKDCVVLNMDVIYAVPVLSRKGHRYDLIFMDPPYDTGYVSTTVGLLKGRTVCRDGALLVVEHSKREQLPGFQEEYEVRSKLYGDTAVSVIRCGWLNNARRSGA
jgi:16S rRNA (guanine(966)-N(2))-methyltransferase RsmD